MNFEQMPFLDLLENIVDNRGKTCPTSDSGIPLIATNCVLNDNLYPTFEKVRFIDDETYRTWFRGHPKPGDMLFVTKGTPGRVCWVPDPVNFCIAQDMVSIRAKKDLVYPKYLFALLRSSTTQKMIENLHVGTLIPHFKKGDFDKLLLPVPVEYEVQKRIGDLYFVLSEKIELNRQTNATLEAIAQAIFKKWFVDFNFPGATGEMVESELGMIPFGWRVGNFLEIADLLSGGTPKTQVSEYWDGSTKWVSAKDVSNAQGTFVLDTERKITQSGVRNSSAKVLPELTTIVTARGSVGNYCILAEPMAMNQTNYGLKSKMSAADYFVFFSLANLVAHLLQVAYGTIFDTVTTKTFEQSKVIIPPNSVIRNFDKQVVPIMGQILNNLQESANIADIRDTLLPKLMNGEIMVNDE